MTAFSLTRRQFGLGLAATIALAPVARALGQDAGTRTVTNWLGTYDIPASPRRVVAIDNRLDLETALALGLPLIAHSRDHAAPWVPVSDDVEFIPGPPSVEYNLGLEPDLIVCMDVPGSDIWPLEQLRGIAPVLPTRYEEDWRENLANLASWTGREQQAAESLADYDAVIAEIATRQAAKRDRFRLAVVHYFADSGEMMVRGAGSTQGRVLADIGGRTLDPAIHDQGAVSMEALPDLLGDVDALFYNDIDGDDAGGNFAALQHHPIWTRLPAVLNNRVYRSMGNTNFGGVYAAKFIAREWDAVYAMLE